MSKPKCPFCGAIMEPSPKGDIFMERGAWEGTIGSSSYAEEGHRDTYLCPKDNAEIALIELPKCT